MPKDPGNPSNPPILDPCLYPSLVTFQVNATKWIRGTNASSFCQNISNAPFFPVVLTYVGFGTWEYFVHIAGILWRVDLSFDCSMPHDAMSGTMLVQTDPPLIQSGYSSASTNFGEGTFLPDDTCNDPAILTVTQI